MPEVCIAGTGLACALGDDLVTAMATLRAGGVRPTFVEVAPDVRWPVYALPFREGAWIERARQTLVEVMAQCGSMARDGPLFVASSSLDIGCREQAMDFSGDFHEFSEMIARWLDWRGPVFTVSTACTSSTNALLSALRWLKAGKAHSAVVLGIELPNRFTLAGFGALQLLASVDPVSFQPEGNGMVLGQAVAAIHLRIGKPGEAGWRFAGGANVVEGSEPAGMHPAAVASMCEKALSHSGMAAARIDLVKPHAAKDSGSLEISALRKVFGRLPPTLSFKQHIGHTLGAAGAAEMVLLMACLDAGEWPEGMPSAPQRVLLSSLGFGGGHAALVLEKRTT